MKLRSLGPGIAVCLTAALFAACSPSDREPSAAQAEAEARPARAAPAEKSDAIETVRRPERRPDPSGNANAGGQYKYIDERGQVRLAARLEDIPERQRQTASQLQTATAQKRPRARGSDDDRASGSAEVTIFTTSSCPYCRAAIAHFEKMGIDYVNRDVEADEEAQAEYLELTGGRRGVPVIVVGDAWIQGWSRPEFDRLLASARP